MLKTDYIKVRMSIIFSVWYERAFDNPEQYGFDTELSSIEYGKFSTQKFNEIADELEKDNKLPRCNDDVTDYQRKTYLA